MIWRVREHVLTFPRSTVIMGVLNVTPDSFSDGGRFINPVAAVEHGMKLAAQGAEIIDVGGESTRPRATPVDEAEELRRVIPVIEHLHDRVTALISIDTMKPAVASAALKAGASIVNDVGASRASDEMWEVVAGSGAGYVLMHMQGNPVTMQEDPRYSDVVADVGIFFADRLEAAARAGVAPQQIALDVGIGFGKTMEHNLQLISKLERFTAFGRPIILGVSRKSFLGNISGGGLEDRLPAALACSTLAVEKGIQILRTHDVPQTVAAARMTEALLERRRT